MGSLTLTYALRMLGLSNRRMESLETDLFNARQAILTEGMRADRYEVALHAIREMSSRHRRLDEIDRIIDEALAPARRTVGVTWADGRRPVPDLPNPMAYQTRPGGPGGAA